MGKKIFIQILGYVIIPLIFSSCLAADYLYDIDIVNNSNHKIGYTVPEVFSEHYPNTALPKTNQDIMYDMDTEVSPGFAHEYPSWKRYFNILPRDTLSIYIFHTDTLNKYPWDIVRDNYMVLKRYDLSLPDLEKLDFKVPYPPSATMSNMKMYPPYNKE